MKKEILNNVINSRVYTIILHRQKLICPKCSYNRGCNANPKKIRNWKKFRIYQWKNSK